MTAMYEMGEWVQVWGQVVETDPHPEEITVRMESHNEGYRALVRRDHVAKAEKPPAFAPRCTALFDAVKLGRGLLRCERLKGHDVDHKDGSVVWLESSVAGWIEER